MLDTAATTVAHVIQLAVAPVFLLSGIGAMLAVMTQRLARVVDRARHLESLLKSHGEPEADIQVKIQILSRRAKLVSRAILFCTVTALLICSVIVVFFLGAWFEFDAALLVSILFVGAMLAFISGLILFLREIFLALASLQIGPVRE